MSDARIASRQTCLWRIDTVAVNDRIRETRCNHERKHRMISF